jgi:glycosyltransferase involved in cell wall biosynthesis
VPVVAKSCTGIREFVEHGREGYLCETDDEMVVNLAHLVNHPEVREQMALHNRTTAPECNWDEVVKRNLQAYEDAARLAGS